MNWWTSIVVVMLLASIARADNATLVFPLSTSGLKGELADAGKPATKALARSIDAKIAKVSIEDAAEMMACDLESTACLEKVAASLGAERLVFGTIHGAGDDLKVTLTRFDAGPSREQKTFVLTSRTTDELTDELVEVSASLFGVEQTEGDEVGPSEAAPRIEKGHEAEVTPSTWVIITIGGLATAVGTGFLVSSQLLREEVNTAPRRTDADFAHLAELEDRGRTQLYIGEALAIGGGVILVAGIVRALVQTRSTRRDSRALRMAPVRGGMAVTFTMELP